ncbi:MAG: HEAT repeat domain-containing protein [Phycisphaerae bacterium]|nr:HEAT repeat domain-containing protein [Gemmatimonadaceae bacterium]
MSDARGYAKALAQLLEELKTEAAESVLRDDLVRVRGYARAQSLAVELTVDHTFLLDGINTDSTLWELRSLVDSMRNHNIARITVLKGAVPKELLQLAILLSKKACAGENESNVFDDARLLSLWSVSLDPFQRASEPSVQVAQAAVLNLLSPEELAVSAEGVVTQVAVGTADSDGAAALEGLCLLYVAETNAPDVVRKSAWTGAFEKAATPASLQLAASLLPEAGTESDVLRGMLNRAGDAGAEALISLLPKADSLTKRRLYFDTIVELGKGIPALVDALNAPQWFVIRDAALLLGEMKAFAAERALGRLLLHTDERVRIAATSALAQMATPSALVLVQSAIEDASTEIRRRAAGAFGLENGGSVSAAPLLRALSGEQSLEVEVEILYALGRVASADAVQKLIRLCSQSGATSKPASYRIAAIEALTVARRSAALPLLRTMMSDSEPTVRATARNLIESVNAMAGSR